MNKSMIWAISTLIALLIIVGGFVRIDVVHADTASFVSFLTGLVTVIPAVAAWVAGLKAHGKAAEAVEKADVAATAAVAAESNTNGKMAHQFDTVHTEIANLGSMVVQSNNLLAAHIANDHGQR